MNYITQLNAFFGSLLFDPISSNAQLLYLHLLNMNNRCNWRKDFTVANTSIQALSGLSRSQLDKARNELCQAGLIEYKKGSGMNAGKYLIVPYGTQSATQSATESAQSPHRVRTKSAHNPGTLDKLKTKPNETREVQEETRVDTPCSLPTTPRSTTPESIQELYNSICVSFRKCTTLSEKRKKAINARLKTGHTQESFKACFQKTEASTFLKGANKRNWIATFDWLIADGNISKVLDGNYDDNQPNQPNQPNPTGFSTSNMFLEICKEEGIF